MRLVVADKYDVFPKKAAMTARQAWEGCVFPFSQFRTVKGDTPRRSASAFCVSRNASR